jgi:hypothetical protein
MKPGFIPKMSKIYPLSEKERSAVKAFINEKNKRKGFISESKSPQVSGFFFVSKKAENFAPVKTTGTSMIGR